MVERLKEAMEENGPENQCGFRPERGTIDGTFNLLMALRKRQEHNLETYVSFVDLVKAFDSVPRAALFKVLRRYGLPDHFINLVIRLHADAVVTRRLMLSARVCRTRVLLYWKYAYRRSYNPLIAKSNSTNEWQGARPEHHGRPTADDTMPVILQEERSGPGERPPTAPPTSRPGTSRRVGRALRAR